MSSSGRGAAPLKQRFVLMATVLPAVFFLIQFFSVPLFVSPQENRTAQAFYNEGKTMMAGEDWYSAVEDFLECLKINPAHSEALSSLAECYYELGEYDEALNWVRKARQFARLNIETENLEAFILIALGKLPEAETLIKNVLSREPYNREALFAAAELDIARGRAGDAASRFKNAVKIYPDDRRLLVSLALVLGSLGDYTGAASYIERAEAEHPDDYRVFYYDAYLASRTGKIPAAIRSAERALALRPDFIPARNLLGSLRYRNGDFSEAVRLADEVIKAYRNDLSAWFLKGMALWQLGKIADARMIFEQALSIAPDDEFLRAAFENLLVVSTPLEDAARKKWAAYHFKRALDYKTRFLSDQALFEYRRGLRINPYADERREYAELLKQQDYPELYLAELRFIQDLGKGNRAVNDAVETYNALLSTSLSRIWDVKTEELQRHWNVAVFSVASQSAFYHTDAATVAVSYIKDLMAHQRNINTMNLAASVPSFSAAFRSAREASASDNARCDYFMIVSISENERDISIKAELFVTRTGAKAAEFTHSRTGQDRLRNAGINIVEQLAAALPFRASLIRRNADKGIIDKGKIDGVVGDTVYDIIKKNKLDIKSDGIGYTYLPSDLVGSFAVTQVDGELSLGLISRAGIFDAIAIGDEIVPHISEDRSGAQKTKPIETLAIDPELRTLLMHLR